MMMEAVLCGIFSGLLLAVMHLVFKLFVTADVHVVVRYVLGVLGLNIPLTVLFVDWWQLQVVYALWIVTIIGGLSVAGLYAVGAWWLRRWQRIETAEWEQLYGRKIEEE